MRSTVLRRLAPALLLVAVAATACDTVADNAATVNGHGIPASTVIDEAKVYRCSDAVGGEFAATLAGKGEGTYDTSALSQLLTDRIHLRLLEDRFAKKGLRVSAAARTNARSQLDQALASLPTAKDRKCVTKEFRDYFVEQRAVSATIQSASLTQDDLLGVLCDAKADVSVTPSYGRWDRSGCRDGSNVAHVTAPAKPATR